jgi:amino acid permease
MNVLLSGNNLLRLNLGAALCLLVITEFLAFLRWRSQSDSITADSKFHFLALCLLVILPFAMFIRIYASSRGAESREKTSFDSTNKTMSQFSGVVIASYVGMITIFSMLY